MPAKLSFSYIERLTGCPHQTVGELNKKLKNTNLKQSDLEHFDDDELKSVIYPKMVRRRSGKPEPEYAPIVAELLKAGKRKKTLMVMYLEYREKYGKQGYKKSRFYQLISEHLKKINICMKLVFLPAEILFIDYAGTQVKYIENGKEVYVPVFVACLGYSKKLFAFATKDMTSFSWLTALYKALLFYGGVPDIIQFDNARAMVLKPGIIAELNQKVKDFAILFGCACDTSRIKTPSDNGNVEAGVKYISQRTLTPMNQDLTFFSIEEINAHLLKEVEKLNSQPFQKETVSRNDLFFADEAPVLNPLPEKPYEPLIYQTTIKKPANNHIRYLGNQYSVPYEFNEAPITVLVRGDKLHIKYKGIIRVTHDVMSGKGHTVTNNAHLHPKHQFEASKTQEEFLKWANDIGPCAVSLVETQYAQTRNNKSRFAGKRCTALQKLCNDYGTNAFMQAAEYALEREMTEPSDVELILKAKRTVEDTVPAEIVHTNIRGKNYFEGAPHGHN